MCELRKEWDDCHKLVFLIPSLVTKVLLIRRLAVLIDWWSLKTGGPYRLVVLIDWWSL